MTIRTSIDQIPERPIISRFVAPWDTSGWYGVFPDFSIGKPLYSNSSVSVVSLPEQYCGFEYIRTFDSKQDGFDDKQEVDFYLEQDAEVYLALDQNAPVSLFPDFADTNDILEASDGTIYRILKAEYLEHAQVHIPGFTGDYHHYVVFVRPKHALQSGAQFETLSASVTYPTYSKREYTWYFHEVFNQMPDDSSPEGFDCTGDCRIVRYPYSPQRKYVSIGANSCLERHVSIHEQVILELSLQVISGNTSVEFAGAVLPISSEGSIDLRFFCNTTAETCTVWINNRENKTLSCSGSSETTIRIRTEEASVVWLDRISLHDNTEIFLLDESFDKMPESLQVSPDAAVSIEAYPFQANKSLCLSVGSCVYEIQPVQDVISVEVKAKASNREFVLLPELRAADGTTALRIAMYQNNLYASNGSVWERIFAGVTDWMYYPCENWYHIKITVDLKKKTYDGFVDGAKRICGFSLLHPVSDIAQIGFFAPDSQLYINELRAYDSDSICRGLMPPNTVFDVKAEPYCACGDGKTLETKILQRAIDDAAYSGGTVYLHDGIFLTGSLNLHSDVTVYLDPSAVLMGTQDHQEYPLYTPGQSLCASRQLGRGILYGQNLCNVRVTGGGTLDGQGLYRFKMNDPVNSRLPDSRPCMIYLTYSNGIVLDDIRFQRSAFWTVVPLSCRNILMQYLDLDCMNTPNRDGIDPVDCCDMTIRRCNIMAGDDGVCFKSSDTFGCENIDVRDMMIQSLASGIKFGTDTYYSLKHVRIHNCAIKNVNRCGISLESVDGADVADVRFEEIDMTNVGAPVYITTGIRERVPRGNAPTRKSQMTDVQFVHMRFDRAYPFSFTKDIREIMIIGQNEEQAIRNILFSDCYLELPGGFQEIPGVPHPIDRQYPEYDCHGLSNGHAFCIRYAQNIQFENCTVKLEQPDVRPMIGYND